MTRRMIALALGLIAALGLAGTAAAHPLGNFTVNQYSRIEAGLDVVHVRYLVDMAEIPAFQERQQIDADHDGALSAAEQQAYLRQRAPELARGLRLSVDGMAAPLRLTSSVIDFPPGQGGLQTLRVTLDLETALGGDGGPKALAYEVANYPERLGWREIVAHARHGAELRDSSALADDRSAELTIFPGDMLTSPLDMREVRFTLAAGAGRPISSGPRPAEGGAPAGASVDALAAMLATRELTPAAMAGALALAMVLGAGHALTPGHGKTIVAAYLVGARGTTRHALALGLVTTLTHTAGVFALGLATLAASRYVLPERIYPWLELTSGALVVVLGLALLRSRVAALIGWGRQRHDHGPHGHDHDHDHGSHDHDHSHDHGPHDHDHSHDHGPHGHSHDHEQILADRLAGTGAGSVTWRGLLALGVSGGLLPCPSALVVLLGAIALGRVGFGLLLILAFSLGLAAVLTGIGLILVHARALLRFFPAGGWLARALPAVSALLVIISGLAITAAAVTRL